MSAEERILDNGYEGVKIFSNYSYDDALIGMSHDNRAIYSYEKMVQWLIEHEQMTELEAVEWIDYNTIGALPYEGNDSPIIMFDLID